MSTISLSLTGCHGNKQLLYRNDYIERINSYAHWILNLICGLLFKDMSWLCWGRTWSCMRETPAPSLLKIHSWLLH